MTKTPARHSLEHDSKFHTPPQGSICERSVQREQFAESPSQAQPGTKPYLPSEHFLGIFEHWGIRALCLPTTTIGTIENWHIRALGHSNIVHPTTTIGTIEHWDIRAFEHSSIEYWLKPRAAILCQLFGSRLILIHGESEQKRQPHQRVQADHLSPLHASHETEGHAKDCVSSL